MRLVHVWIESWKNLRELAIEFDPSYPISVIVGRNGTGKSNLLEALTLIFRDLDLGWQTGFGYDIEYEVRGHAVRIENRPSRKVKRNVSIDGKRASVARLRSEG